ncbi:YppG family protein [Virgibacillus pantothenticus]|uniref:YppG family protein n=1 Tax=Virgibacillus pantothenticus TaxID=1473 RepID=UPI0009856232|nr:YppG family protein [Virgibacillus pantothenticus]
MYHRPYFDYTAHYDRPNHLDVTQMGAQGNFQPNNFFYYQSPYQIFAKPEQPKSWPGTNVQSSNMQQQGFNAQAAHPNMEQGFNAQAAHPNMEQGFNAQAAQPNMEQGFNVQAAQPNMQQGFNAQTAQPYMEQNLNMQANQPAGPGQSFDLDKMLSTVGQLANTYHQVSPIVKQFGSFIKAFR